MSELSKLSTKKEYDINGTKLTLESLELDEDMAEFIEMKEDVPKEKMTEMMKKVIKKTLKISYPDADDEEIRQCMKMKNLMPLMEAVSDVNGMSKETNRNSTSVIKDRLNAMKEANAIKQAKSDKSQG